MVEPGFGSGVLQIRVHTFDPTVMSGGGMGAASRQALLGRER